MLKNIILLTFIALCLICSVDGTSEKHVQPKKSLNTSINSLNQEATEKSTTFDDKFSEFSTTTADQNSPIETSTKVALLVENEKNDPAHFETINQKTESKKPAEGYFESLISGPIAPKDLSYLPRSGESGNPEYVLRGGDFLDFSDLKNQTDAKNVGGKGTVSKIGYFPSQTDVKDALTSKHKCSGTLVEDKHVLSSARCVVNSVAKELAVMAGDISLLPGETPTRETRRVQVIAVHPDYVEGEDVGLEFNIAVLKLDMAFTRGNYLHPALIPNKRVANNTLCFLVGWGLGKVDDSEVTESYELYYSDVFTMDMEQCYKCVGNSICAGSNQTKACIGDEAGPLMCNGVLHGIYIASANNCQSLTGIYTDVVFYKHWIDRIIEWGGNGPMPVPLPYARKRTFTMLKSKIRNRSQKMVNIFNSIFQLILLLVLLPWS